MSVERTSLDAYNSVDTERMKKTILAYLRRHPDTTDYVMSLNTIMTPNAIPSPRQKLVAEGEIVQSGTRVNPTGRRGKCWRLRGDARPVHAAVEPLEVDSQQRLHIDSGKDVDDAINRAW